MAEIVRYGNILTKVSCDLLINKNFKTVNILKNAV